MKAAMERNSLSERGSDGTCVGEITHPLFLPQAYRSHTLKELEMMQIDSPDYQRCLQSWQHINWLRFG
jgi:hypothetical protein